MVKTISEVYDIKPDALDAKSPLHNVRISMFVDVTNSAHLLTLLKQRTIDCALVNGDLIVQPFQLLAACHRAILSLAHNKLATRGVHTEIVYSLSPTKNVRVCAHTHMVFVQITDSLQRFGISDTTRNVLLIVHDDKSGAKTDAIAAQIQCGANVHLSKLMQMYDLEQIKEVRNKAYRCVHAHVQAYHLTSNELNKTPLDDAIVSRIAAKDFA